MKIALCLMVKNELKGCEIDIPRINQKLFNEVFAVDAGSVDGTVEFLKNNNIKVSSFFMLVPFNLVCRAGIEPTF